MNGSKERHQKIQDNLEARLKKYGYKTYSNFEYKNDKGRTLGEVDLMAFSLDKDGLIRHITLYEVKSGDTEYRHARQQLHRAKDYFQPNSRVPIHMVYINQTEGDLIAKRVR